MPHYIGFTIRELGLTVEKYIQTIANKSGLEHLDGPQGAVLSFLNSRQEEQTVQKDIEQFLKIQKATASALIKRMERNGFISVSPSNEDKRYKIIQVTDKGKEKQRIIERFLNYLDEQLTQGITKKELMIFETIIEKIIKNTNEGEYKC